MGRFAQSVALWVFPSCAGRRTAVAVGWVVRSVSGRRRLRPAIGATVALLAAVLAYYACDEVVSAVRSVDLRGIPAPREEPPAPGYVPEVLTWALAALVTGPLLGLAGAAAPPWAKVRARPAE